MNDTMDSFAWAADQLRKPAPARNEGGAALGSKVATLRHCTPTYIDRPGRRQCHSSKMERKHSYRSNRPKHHDVVQCDGPLYDREGSCAVHARSSQRSRDFDIVQPKVYK